MFGIAWWARSCQHNRKVDTYRTYFDGVAAAIDDSVALGKQVSSIMDDPTKLSRKELIAKLGQLAAQQEEIAVRAGRLEPPGTLDDEQTVFATGMKVRASGFSLLRTAMLGALANKKVGAKEIAALDGYFSGPDAYYQELVYQPARETMADEGVSDVAVPTSTYYLTWKALDPATVTLALESVGKSSKLSGIHGVALIDVTAKGSSGDVKLVQRQVQRRAGLARPRLRRPGPEPGQRDGEGRRRHGHARASRRRRTPSSRRRPSPPSRPARRRTSPSPGSPSRPRP